MATKPKKQTKAAAPKLTALDKERALINGETKKFDKEVAIAGEWCAEQKVPLVLTPVEALMLAKQRDAIRAAVLRAGGPDKVPTPVLLYEQTLDDAVHFLMDHGVMRAITYLRLQIGR